MCNCVGLKFQRAFSKRSYPALKHSSLAQSAFFLRASSVRLQHNKFVRLPFGNPEKERKLEEKVFVKVISVKDGAEKGQKQGRNGRRIGLVLLFLVHNEIGKEVFG